jgi:hypothetical protein
MWSFESRHFWNEQPLRRLAEYLPDGNRCQGYVAFLGEIGFATRNSMRATQVVTQQLGFEMRALGLPAARDRTRGCHGTRKAAGWGIVQNVGTAVRQQETEEV